MDSVSSLESRLACDHFDQQEESMEKLMLCQSGSSFYKDWQLPPWSQEPELPSKKSNYTQGILYDQALSLLEEREGTQQSPALLILAKGPDM